LQDDTGFDYSIGVGELHVSVDSEFDDSDFSDEDRLRKSEGLHSKLHDLHKAGNSVWGQVKYDSRMGKVAALTVVILPLAVLGVRGIGKLVHNQRDQIKK
jgi:hypothetical protein